MGFMDFFSPSQQTSTSARPASKEEKTISRNLAAQSTESMPLWRGLVGQSQGQLGFNDALFNQFQQQMAGFNQAFSPFQQGQQLGQNQASLTGLGNQQQDLINQAITMAGLGANLTPEQAALIQQYTDLGIQQGLSDLGQYRDRGLETIAQNSAQRGLRPTDTPIFNQSSQFAQESNRQAEQLISGLRQQQAQQMLEYPLKAGSFGMQQLSGASDLAGQREQFLAGLNAENQQNQLNFGRGITQTGLNLAQGSSGASALPALVSQRNFTRSNTQSSQTPSGASLTAGFLGF